MFGNRLVPVPWSRKHFSILRYKTVSRYVLDCLTQDMSSGRIVGESTRAARHTFASLMIAAGVNAKALATYMGHASVTITYDRYGHLMPGNEDEAAGLLDAYLERANTRARLASITGR
jgi:integrase